MQEHKTKIILGPPGTGKTTTLLTKVEDALEQGVSPERIAYLSFTKKAAEEAIERAVLKFPTIDRKRFVNFRTIHSLAFRLLGLESAQVMQQSHYTTVGAKLGLTINVKRATNEDEEAMYSPGDKCHRIYGLHRSTKEPLADVYRKCNDQFVQECPLDLVEAYKETIDNYKNFFNLLDFHDFLDHCVMQKKKVDVDVFIVDEAQDLTKQQWEFVKAIVNEDVQEIIIAGDDDQAIYSWSGCDVGEFFSIKGERIVLPISYRLPKAVFEHAEYIVNKIEKRISKQWQPSKQEEGMVKWLGDVQYAQIDNGEEWLLLARTNMYLRSYIRFCRDMGVVYNVYGAWSNRSDQIMAVILYENLRAGKELSHAEINLVLKFVKDAPKVIRKNKKYKYAEIEWPWGADKPVWMDCLKIHPDEKNYIIKLRSKKVSLTAPGNIKISTIHGAKGGEADNVLVNVKISNKIQKDIQYSQKAKDDEIRVWYVALTRSKNNIFLYGDELLLREL